MSANAACPMRSRAVTQRTIRAVDLFCGAGCSSTGLAQLCAERAEPREHPIIFSAEMVRAVLAGRKTQMRHPVTPPDEWANVDSPRMVSTHARCPFGAPGDRMFVKETFELRREFDRLSPAAVGKRQGSDVLYLADQGINPSGCHGHFEWGRTRRSIHMPRWASRITLEVTEVRVQRVQSISKEDAEAEGCWRTPKTRYPDVYSVEPPEFRRVWDEIWAKRGLGWDANPWVWAVTFRRVQP